MPLKIKNWKRFQHFKDRKPPWIKLYRDLLDDINWHELNADAAKVMVSLWLIASESDGVLPPISELAFRLRLSEKQVKSNVSKLSHWLIQDDINTISDISVISARNQDNRLETETETETETEAHAPDGARMLLEKLPVEWERFATDKRPEINPHEVFDGFRDYWIAQPGRKGVKADWFATWRNWVRNQKINGVANGKFHAIQYTASRLAKTLDGSPAPKAELDVHGEVQPLLSRQGNG